MRNTFQWLPLLVNDKNWLVEDRGVIGKATLGVNVRYKLIDWGDFPTPSPDSVSRLRGNTGSLPTTQISLVSGPDQTYLLFVRVVRKDISPPFLRESLPDDPPRTWSLWCYSSSPWTLVVIQLWLLRFDSGPPSLWSRTRVDDLGDLVQNWFRSG